MEITAHLAAKPADLPTTAVQASKEGRRRDNTSLPNTRFFDVFFAFFIP